MLGYVIYMLMELVGIYTNDYKKNNEDLLTTLDKLKITWTADGWFGKFDAILSIFNLFGVVLIVLALIAIIVATIYIYVIK